LKFHILLKFCPNEIIRIYYLKISIMYIITFISFWKSKIIWTIYFLISLFHNISMTIHLKKKMFNKWIFFWVYNNTTYVRLFLVNIVLLFINLNYFTLHYLWLFSISFRYFLLLHTRLPLIILSYFWLFYVVFGYFNLFTLRLFSTIISYSILCYL
jgi:hypothetical protein